MSSTKTTTKYGHLISRVFLDLKERDPNIHYSLWRFMDQSSMYGIGFCFRKWYKPEIEVTDYLEKEIRVNFYRLMLEYDGNPELSYYETFTRDERNAIETFVNADTSKDYLQLKKEIILFLKEEKSPCTAQLITMKNFDSVIKKAYTERGLSFKNIFYHFSPTLRDKLNDLDFHWIKKSTEIRRKLGWDSDLSIYSIAEQQQVFRLEIDDNEFWTEEEENPLTF